MDSALIIGLFVLMSINLSLGVAAVLMTHKSQKAWEALIAALRAARRR